LIDTESTQTARTRLLASGKSLFARLGYEQTSTAAIAREALTSESQLVRHFEGKAGLLAAIFEESWRPLNDAIQSVVADAPNARDAVLAVLSTVVSAFGKDVEAAFLLLFEGRRVRGGTEIVLSRGSVEFTELLQRLVRRGQRDGTFPGSFAPAAVAAALIGAAEGMIRERLMARRSGKPSPYTEEEMVSVFTSMLTGLAAAPAGASSSVAAAG
jgi:TetR/AcrR family transcriptional regulator, fatty acid metabolism regulator protein